MEPNTGGYLPSLVEILILVYTKPVDKQQQKQKQQKRGILFGQIARLSWTACPRVHSQAAQVWNFVCESLTPFRKLLGYGPRYKNTSLSLCSYAFWVFLGRFKRFFSFDSRMESSQLCFFIYDNFRALSEI